MEDLVKLQNSLASLSKLTKAKQKSKKLSKEDIMSLVMYHYGYQTAEAIVQNKISAKMLLSMMEYIRTKRLQDVVDSTIAARVAQTDKKTYEKIMKQWQKEASK